MNLSGNKSRLVGATREISLRWAQTREHWRDDQSRKFDQKYMQELVARVGRTATIMDKLGEVLTKIESDCE